MTPTTIAWHRFGLGARPQDAAPADPKGWLLRQFDRYQVRPRSIANQPSVIDALDNFLAVRDLGRVKRSGNGPANVDDQINSLRRANREMYGRAVIARSQAAIVSDAPFLERMVHFWANHFSVSAGKVQIRPMVGAFEFEAIRPHVMGKFGDMLRDVEIHPAMLIYLDQFRSTGPGSVVGEQATRRGRNVGLNENLAREILELHTLGVNGGYTQADVTEFAKALTGWSIADLPTSRRAEPLPNGSAWAQNFHEKGTRTIMGVRHDQPDHRQSLSILDQLAKHPSTAQHIATKLARHFAGDEPPLAMVKRLKTVFLDTDGDLPSLYRAIIDSPEAWAARPLKFRTPWEWTIASLRATGVEAGALRRMPQAMAQLGQPVWAASSPQGFADTQAEWAAPDAILRRVELAAQISRQASITDVNALARELFPDSLNDNTATWISRSASPQQGLALLLASPEMMRR